MRYHIESSHMVAVPDYIDAPTILKLRRGVQAIADSKQVRSDRPPIGTVTYRYELDPDGVHADVVHCFFIGSNGKRRRFMRLRREQGSCIEDVRVEVWNFYVGSDDGRYIFVREPREDEDLADHGQPTDVITVPLMPEAA